ncbi:hypothetical protein [Chryseobacterium herbae]|uniref:Uncharacterized protein n=1 Tax=Chryseobacterium herbae TaxID=2976476 RepID=A0ABT2IWI5_9FLAO|nr:hypothetical protein [Chryseobacterium sp. pc1-10]MCT2563182.1 hypothetical protein [Chryseobacterium sp. pc1-10]
MKKLLTAMSLALGLGFATAQQTAPATTAAPHHTTKTVKAPAAKTAQPAATAKPAQPAQPAAKMKKDGTPDKRYKENKNLKKDGTPDKRYKANK